jgi:hypothetical protein
MQIPADGGASGASTTSPFHASGVLRMRGKNGYTRHCSAGERVLRIRGKNGHSVALYRMECSIYTIRTSYTTLYLIYHPIPILYHVHEDRFYTILLGPHALCI